MLKKITSIFLILFSALTLAGCTPKAIILFNNNPITKETLLDNANEFTVEKRFYYIFITQKQLDTNIIRVRVLKKEDPAHKFPTKIIYSNDFRLNKDQVFYYNDYLTIHQPGYYMMIIYARDALAKPLACADFKVD